MHDDAMLRETTLLALDTAITEADVYAAIADVLDPELDEPLVKLGFIIRLRIADVIVDEITDSVFVMTPGGAVRLEKMGHNAAIYLRRRHYLGLPRGEDDLFITDDKGQPVPSDGLQDFLRRSRSIRLNIMFNTSLCTSLFRTRYEGADSSEAYRPREGEMI